MYLRVVKAPSSEKDMSSSEIWARASEIYAARGTAGKVFALRQALRARWNDDESQMDDWLVIASRIKFVATLH
jgi:hypothetical protein